MIDTRLARDLDELAARVLDWADEALSLGESYFPTEVRRELQDLIDEFASIADELDPMAMEQHADAVARVFTSAEMAEVLEQFPSIEYMIEEEIGHDAVAAIQSASAHFDLDSLEMGGGDDDDD